MARTGILAGKEHGVNLIWLLAGGVVGLQITVYLRAGYWPEINVLGLIPLSGLFITTGIVGLAVQEYFRRRKQVDAA